MSSYDRRTMFRFLFVSYLMCKALPGGLSQSLTDKNEPPHSHTIGKRTTRCSWECRVLRSFDFVPEMKARIGMYRILSLDLKLRKSADDKCQNQTDSYGSSKLADTWMWSTVNPLTHEGNVFYGPGGGDSSGLFRKSFEGRMQGTVACTFIFLKEPTAQQIHSSMNDLIAKALVEEVGVSTGTVLCYKEGEQNSLYVCLTIDKGTEWPVRALSGFTILIFVMSIIFFPVVLCLFSPTHVCSNQNPADLIVLEGPSHISIRGWVANFVSKVSLKLLPLSRKGCLIFLLTAVAILSFASGLHPSFKYPYLDKLAIDPRSVTKTVMLAFGILCGIRGLMRVFFTQLSFAKPCFVCRHFIGEETSHRTSELEDEIKQHLRIQPLIFAKCWREFFCNYVQMYSQICCEKATHRRLLTICHFLGLVLLMPIALSVLLLVYLVLILVLVFYSCPISTIFDFYIQYLLSPEKLNGDRERCLNKCMMVVSIIIVSTVIILPYAGGVSLLLLMFTSTFIKALTTILSLENIPYLTFLVLSTFHCSSCYYSFTGKYDDLAAKLYSFLKKRVQQDGNQHALNLEHNKKKAIPKRLFDKACKETMPLGENIYKSLLRIFIILVFFSLIFTIVMETPGIPERMKITTTFLVAAMPMIIEIVVLKKGDEMKKLKQEELVEKIRSIVDEYEFTGLVEIVIGSDLQNSESGG